MLLSEKDFAIIQSAMDTEQEISFVRSMDSLRVMIRTMRVKSPWTVPVIVQVRTQQGPIATIKNCESVREARRYLSGN